MIRRRKKIFIDNTFKAKAFTIFGKQITINKKKYKLIGTTVSKSTFDFGGWGNGYVIVDKTHPAFGLKYPNVNVHGGITYCEEVKESKFFDIYVEHGWVFGFDTGRLEDTKLNWGYKDVISETLNLANQLEKYNKI
jgi:hypothetical protein